MSKRTVQEVLDDIQDLNIKGLTSDINKGGKRTKALRKEFDTFTLGELTEKHTQLQNIEELCISHLRELENALSLGKPF